MKRVAVAVSLVGIATVGVAANEGDATLGYPAGTANIWTDTNGGTCVRASTPGNYNEGTACLGLNKAYAIAEPGDTLRMRTGVYAAETIAYRSALEDLSPPCDPYGEWGSASSANCVKVIPDGGNVIWNDKDFLVKGPSLWLAGTATGSAPNFSSRTYNFQVDTGLGSGFGDPLKHGNLHVIGDVHAQSPSYVTIENSYFGCVVGMQAQGGACNGAVSLDLQDGQLSNWLVRYNAFYDDWAQRTGADAQTAPFSFQQAYDAAPNGAVVEVPAGQVAVDSAARNSATIFASPTGPSNKAVTFECADQNGLVTFPPGKRLTIKAYNVTLRGACFRLRVALIGEGGDSARAAGNILIDGVKMEGVEVVGTQATIRNSEIGPNVKCYPQGATGVGLSGGQIRPSMWCNPSGPSYESDYASQGNVSLVGYQPYFHNNAGGVPSQVVFENNYVHDVQTRDAFNLHTGCGIVWQNGGAPGQIVIRNNRYERCAVLGVLFDHTDFVLFEGNWMAPPIEPLSNPTGGQEAGSFAKELVFKAGGQAREWLVKGNTFCHGTRADGATTLNVRFESNDLGRADARWAGATYIGNTNVGGACSGGSPPPPPPPAQCADGIDNDSDERIDYPADPGCLSASDTDETDAPAHPSPPAQCSDGLDNDSDHLVDLADPGCADSADNDEQNTTPPVDQPPSAPAISRSPAGRSRRRGARRRATRGTWSGSSAVIGNVLQGAASVCKAGVTWDYNVFVAGTSCGTNTTTSTRTAVWPTSIADPDFHLLNGTNPANNFVVPTTSDYALGTDFDGASRPIGANRDAGPDER